MDGRDTESRALVSGRRPVLSRNVCRGRKKAQNASAKSFRFNSFYAPAIGCNPFQRRKTGAKGGGSV
jgi:hypothetical protein